MTEKEKYIQFCEENEEISIFYRPWWFDAVAGKNEWNVLLLENKNGEIEGYFPYVIKNEFGLKTIKPPKLTQFFGPIIIDTQTNYSKQLSKYKAAIFDLLPRIPSVDQIKFKLPYQFTNWQPFYWKGFEQTTNYSYYIGDLSNLNQVWDNFQSNIKREIKKAQKIVSVEQDLSIEKYYEMVQMTFGRQNKKVPYSFEQVKRIDDVCKNSDSRKIFFAIDEEKNIHSALYLIWDNKTAIYLMGGSNPDLRNSGAASLLFWEAIKFASEKGLSFDFEGSMLEPVERFVRAFGGQQRPYLVLTKHSPKFDILFHLLKVLQAVKRWIKRK